MNQLTAHITIKSPTDDERIIELVQERYTIGRVPEFNDIGLPEEDGIISRRDHCILIWEPQQERWWLVDQSTNGTILERKGEQVQLQDLEGNKILLSNGDRLIIHSYELVFIDPNQKASLYDTTKDLKSLPFKSKYQTPFVFNVSQLSLYYLENGEKKVIKGLRANAIDMLAFMAKKNLYNNGQPIVCEYEDLMGYIWRDDPYDKTPQDVHTLAKEIRSVFRQYVDTPEDFLETKRTRGYLLKIDCEV